MKLNGLIILNNGYDNLFVMMMIHTSSHYNVNILLKVIALC